MRCPCFRCGKPVLISTASEASSMGTFQGWVCPSCQKSSSTSILQTGETQTTDKLPSPPSPPLPETTLDEVSPPDKELEKKLREQQTLLSSLPPTARLLEGMIKYVSSEVIQSDGTTYEDMVTKNIESYTPYLKRIIDGLWAMQASFEGSDGSATAADMLNLIQNLERAHTGLWKFLQEYRSKHTVPAVLPQDNQEVPGLEG